jgi:O-antigen/teichoic acid export membrane protein
MGALFFIMQLSCILAYSLDNLILLKFAGPHSVATFSIAQRLFSIGPLILGLVASPLWPAYSEAAQRGDAVWVWRTFRRSLILGVAICGGAAAVCAIFSEEILRVWLQKPLAIPPPLLWAAAVWCLLGAFGGTAAPLLNGLGALRSQAVCGVIFSVTSLAAKVAIAKSYGPAGIVWTTVAFYPIVVVPLGLMLFRAGNVPGARKPSCHSEQRP